MVLVKHLPRMGNVYHALGRHRPRQAKQHLEIRPDDRVLRGSGGQALESRKLTVHLLASLLGELLLLRLLTQSVHLGGLLVLLAQLLLDRAELLSQEVLSLSLAHRLLRLGLYLSPQLENL